MGGDIILYFAYKVVGHILVAPAGGVSTLHKSDTWNTVDDGVVVTMMPFHAYLIRIVDGIWFAGEVLLVVDFDWIVFVESYYVAIFNVDRRYAVVCSCDETLVVKSDLVCTGFYGFIPVDFTFAHAEVPFAYCTGGISSSLHHFGDSVFIFADDQRSVAWQNFSIWVTPWIHAGHECIAAWS